VESELHAKDGSIRIAQQKITVIPTQKGHTLFGSSATSPNTPAPPVTGANATCACADRR
jgi:hypothetical protein